MIRRIETKEQQNKKSKRNKWILSGILVAILLFSVFGIVFQDIISSGSSKNQTVVFNGYTFDTSSGYYTLRAGNATLYFSENPVNVDAIVKSVNLTKTFSYYSGKVVYVSSVDDYNSYNEIYANVGLFAERVQEACVEGEPCIDQTLPIKTCSDNVIVIKKSLENKIYEKNNCVYIEGKESDLLGMTDEFLLRILGIK